MSRYDDLRYVVLHSHPEKLILSPQMREQIISSGKVIDVIECSTYSFQDEYIKRITRRPLIVVLWGMEDRYGLAAKLDIEIMVAKNYSEVMSLTDDQRILGKQGNGYNTFWGDPSNPEHLAMAEQWRESHEDTGHPIVMMTEVA